MSLIVARNGMKRVCQHRMSGGARQSRKYPIHVRSTLLARLVREGWEYDSPERRMLIALMMKGVSRTSAA
jgi:hypothetical protein